MMIHEYKTGRMVCGLAEIGAWLVVIISVFMILAALGTASKGGGYEFALAALLPAFIVLIVGFILIILIQMARASMDSSVAAQKSVIQSQKHHEDLVRQLRSFASRAAAGDTSIEGSAAGFADLEANSPASGANGDAISYRGHQIKPDGGQFRVHGVPFKSLGDAKAHIDQIAVEAAPADLIANTPSQSATEVLYNGFLIDTKDNVFTVGSRSFGGMSLAKRHVDRLIARGDQPPGRAR